MRVALRVAQMWDIKQHMLSEGMSGVLGYLVEAHLAQGKSGYNSAISLLLIFPDLADSLDKESVLSVLVEEGQEALAQKWAATLGRDYQVYFVERCIASNRLRTASHAVRAFDLRADFPDVEMMYKQRSITRLLEKRVWDVAATFAGSHVALQTQVVMQILGTGDVELAETYRVRFGLPEGATKVDPAAMAAQEQARAERYLQMDLPPEAITWVDSIEGLRSAAVHLQAAPAVAIDVEWKPTGFHLAPAQQGQQEGQGASQAQQQEVQQQQQQEAPRQQQQQQQPQAQPHAAERAPEAAGDSTAAAAAGGSNHHHSGASIVQLGIGDRVFILDLIALGRDARHRQALEECLEPVMSSKACLKLGFELNSDLSKLASTFQDLRAFAHVERVLELRQLWEAHLMRKHRGVVTRLQRSAGLSTLASTLLGKPLDKSMQCTDWEARPLSQRQLTYAALDAHVLLRLHTRLHELIGPGAAQLAESMVTVFKAGFSQAHQQRKQYNWRQHVKRRDGGPDGDDDGAGGGTGGGGGVGGGGNSSNAPSGGGLSKRMKGGGDDDGAGSGGSSGAGGNAGCGSGSTAAGDGSSGGTRTNGSCAGGTGSESNGSKGRSCEAQGAADEAGGGDGADGAVSCMGGSRCCAGAALHGLPPLAPPPPQQQRYAAAACDVTSGLSALAIDDSRALAGPMQPSLQQALLHTCSSGKGNSSGSGLAPADSQQPAAWGASATAAGIPAALADALRRAGVGSSCFVRVGQEQLQGGSMATGTGAAEALGVHASSIAKSLALFLGGAPCVAVLRADQRLDMTKVSAAAGVPRRSIRFASSEECVATFGYPPGTLPPFGHVTTGVHVLLDVRLADAWEPASGAGPAGAAPHAAAPPAAPHGLAAPAARQSPPSPPAAASATAADRPDEGAGTAATTSSANHAAGAAAWPPAAAGAAGRRCRLLLAGAGVDCAYLRLSAQQLLAASGATVADIAADAAAAGGAEAAAAATGAAATPGPAAAGHGCGLQQPEQRLQEPWQQQAAAPSQQQVAPQQPQAAAPCFLLDGMLGRLARWLRCLGVDAVLVQQQLTRQELAAAATKAAQEGRVFLTRNFKLAARRDSGGAYLLSSDVAEEQLWEVSRHFGVELDQQRMMTRCSVCNAADFSLAPKAEVRLLVPERVYGMVEEFYRCGGCGKIFWMGPKSYSAISLLEGMMCNQGHGMGGSSAMTGLPQEQ